MADYGVLALWDYGYWITRVARRVPVTNPRQSGVSEAAAFLLSSNEPDANRVIERLGARYIAVDWQLQATSPWAPAAKELLRRGSRSRLAATPRRYCGLFWDEAATTGKRGEAVVYCYPEYYRTMAMRLYLYGGRAATAGPVTVLSYRREVRNGMAVNVVTGDWSFTTYEEASRFVTTSGRSDMKIVSKDPHVTCVPLEALANYTSVFRALERDGTEPLLLRPSSSSNTRRTGRRRPESLRDPTGAAAPRR